MNEMARDYAAEQRKRDHEAARELRDQVLTLIGEARVSAAATRRVMGDPEAADLFEYCKGELQALERFAEALMPIADGLVDLVCEDLRV